jgi:hypothetical protein
MAYADLNRTSHAAPVRVHREIYLDKTIYGFTALALGICHLSPLVAIIEKGSLDHPAAKEPNETRHEYILA